MVYSDDNPSSRVVESGLKSYIKWFAVERRSQPVARREILMPHGERKHACRPMTNCPRIPQAPKPGTGMEKETATSVGC